MMNSVEDKKLIQQVVQLVENANKQVVIQANSTLTVLFWQVGNTLNTSILHNQRAEYGKQIVVTVSRELTQLFGRSYEEKNLRRMMQFSEKFPDIENVVTLSRQLSWSHFLAIIPLKTNEERSFYTKLVAEQPMSVRNLRKHISKKTFERTSLANIQLEKSPIEQNIFKDPYLLDFLNLPKGYLENELESAILRELETFILELGKGFAFVERQKRMIIDSEDFYLDLLFYHRKLKRLVAIELKIDKFKAKHKGQMELYLKWLDKYEKQEGENAPIGLILCAEAGKEQIELLETHKEGIMVAEYWTELPPKNILEEKLQQAVQNAKLKIKNHE